jgi:uncharacterized protein
MAYPPVHHRDRALRRLSLVTKGLAVSAIFATGGIVAAIAQASPAPKTTKPPVGQPGEAPGAAVPRDTATTPASRGRGRVPVAPTVTRAPGGRIAPPAAPARTTATLAPPPAPPTDPPTEAPVAVPEPTDSGGS